MAKPKRALPPSDPTNGAAETPADMQSMLETNGAALAAAMQASEAMLQGLAELNREMMNFATDRLRKGIETSESLMGCQNPADASESTATTRAAPRRPISRRRRG